MHADTYTHARAHTHRRTHTHMQARTHTIILANEPLILNIIGGFEFGVSARSPVDVPCISLSLPLHQVLCGRGCEALLSGDLEGGHTDQGVQLVEQHIHKNN